MTPVSTAQVLRKYAVIFRRCELDSRGCCYGGL